MIYRTILMTMVIVDLISVRSFKDERIRKRDGNAGEGAGRVAVCSLSGCGLSGRNACSDGEGLADGRATVSEEGAAVAFGFAGCEECGV